MDFHFNPRDAYYEVTAIIEKVCPGPRLWRETGYEVTVDRKYVVVLQGMSISFQMYHGFVLLLCMRQATPPRACMVRVLFYTVRDERCSTTSPLSTSFFDPRPDICKTDFYWRLFYIVARCKTDFHRRLFWHEGRCKADFHWCIFCFRHKARCKADFHKQPYDPRPGVKVVFIDVYWCTLDVILYFNDFFSIRKARWKAISSDWLNDVSAWYQTWVKRKYRPSFLALWT